jgi:hypothetical protein
MPRSERDSEDSTGVLKSDFVVRRGDLSQDDKGRPRPTYRDGRCSKL